MLWMTPQAKSTSEHIFKTWDEAALFALNMAIAGNKVNLDVLVYSQAGARFVGGDRVTV